MIERYVSLHPVIIECFSESHQYLMLSNSEIELIKELSQILKPFKVVTKVITYYLINKYSL